MKSKLIVFITLFCTILASCKDESPRKGKYIINDDGNVNAVVPKYRYTIIEYSVNDGSKIREIQTNGYENYSGSLFVYKDDIIYRLSGTVIIKKN